MRTLRRTSYLAAAASLVVIALAVSPIGATEDPRAERATYSVVFVPSWNPATHPDEYPLTHAKQGLLTPIIGATHGDDYRLFDEGAPPSLGLETLSETGMHTPLDQEIRQAIADGTATTLVAFTDGSPGPVHAPVAHQFDINRNQPFVSLAGMIAPSPDWFYGVSSVQMLDDGQWVASVVVPAYAWDSGGDAGMTYLAEDMDLTSKRPTKHADTKHFRQGSQSVPVGVFVFKRIPATS